MNRTIITLLAGVATLGFVSSTYAADLIVDAEPMAPMYEAASGNWDGAYIGVFGGYGWGTLTDEEGYWDLVDEEYDTTGWLVGLTAGADFTVSEAIVACRTSSSAPSRASAAGFCFCGPRSHRADPREWLPRS